MVPMLYESSKTSLWKLVFRLIFTAVSFVLTIMLLFIFSVEYIFHPTLHDIDEIHPYSTKQTPALSHPNKPIVPPPSTLDDSDQIVRRAFEDFAPSMPTWLARNQIRNWVYTIDLMADGYIPKKNNPINIRTRGYQVVIIGKGDNARYYPAGRTFSKNMLVAKLVIIDPIRLASYYQNWLPILEVAYHQMGGKDKLDRRFRLAIERVLAVKPLLNKPELIKKNGFLYLYADPKYESASEVEKMLWRFGADNTIAIQSFLRSLLFALPVHSELPIRQDYHNDMPT